MIDIEKNNHDIIYNALVIFYLELKHGEFFNNGVEFLELKFKK